MQELAPGVYVETGFRLINVGAIETDDGFILIDTPPYPDDAHAWQHMLAQKADKPILAIINTDCHYHRILGNCWFDVQVIVAHDETITHLQNLPSTFLDTMIDSLAHNETDRNLFAGARQCLPSVGFSHRIQLRYGGKTIPLIAMPGPTAGNLWIHLTKQSILFVGDSVLAEQHPHILNPCTKLWLDNLTVLRRPRFVVEHIVPGRGPAVDKQTTEPISNYLRLARRRVYSLYRTGRPRADMSVLVPELLDLFPYAEEDLEHIQRCIRSGLDRIYEEFKINDKSNSTPEDDSDPVN